MAAAAGQAGDAPEGLFNGRRLMGAAMMVTCGGGLVIDTPGVALKLTAGALMVVAGLCLILARRFSARLAGLLAISLTIAAGITTMVLVPQGLGEVPALAGAANLPRHLPVAGRAASVSASPRSRSAYR